MDIEEFRRLADERFATALEMIRQFEETLAALIKFEEEALAAALAQHRTAKTPPTQQIMQRCISAAESSRSDLTRYLGAVRDHGALFQTLRIREYWDAVGTIMAQPERRPTVAEESFLAARAAELRWALPSIQESVSQSVIILAEFAKTHLEIHARFLNAPIPGKLSAFLTMVLKELSRVSPFELLGIDIPPLAKRLIDMVDRYRNPRLSFSAQTTSDLDRIHEYIEAARLLHEDYMTRRRQLEDADAEVHRAADEFKEFARDIFVSYMEP